MRLIQPTALEEGESLSSFVEQSVRAQVGQRKAQQVFIARGLASRDKVAESGRYVPSAVALENLEKQLAVAQARTKAGGNPA